MGTASQILNGQNKMRHASHFFLKNTFQQMLRVMIFTLILFPACSQIQHVDIDPVENTIERSFYENGQMEYEASYLHGKLDGTSKVWYPDGILKSTSAYKLGLPHGAWEKYYENGEKMYEVHYSNGLKDGTEKWFYENGSIKSEQEFKADKPISDITRWKIDGTLLY
jgi:antitoxin component YwqK of YwqJK toxin-antitoxin module